MALDAREPAAEVRSRAPVEWPVPHQPVVGTRDGLGARLEATAARVTLETLVRLPIRLRDALVSLAARAARRIDRRRSDAAREFLGQALGDLPRAELEARVLQAWRHLFTVTIETEGFARRVPDASALEHFAVELCPEARALAGSGRGCVFVTGHVGDWEAAPAALSRLGFAPFYAVAKPPRNKPLSIRVQSLREARGIRLLPRRGAMKSTAAILGAGGSIGLLLDQRARKNPVLAPFFGRLARCDRSAGVLLKRMRAPILVGACYRTAPYRWRLRVPKVLRPEDLARASGEEIAARLNAELEELILAAPDQYFWLHDRYRGTEPGDAEPGFPENASNARPRDAIDVAPHDADPG